MTSSASACLTVVREVPYERASSRSGGTGLPGVQRGGELQQLALHLVVLGQPRPGVRAGHPGRVIGRKQRSGHPESLP